MPNKQGFEQVTDGIYRLCVPFENIYTGVFAVLTEKECILIDSAASSEDARNYILPALRERGWEPDWLLISHLHGDHCGGLPALKEQFPAARVGMFCRGSAAEYSEWDVRIMRGGEVLGGCLEVLNLPGHTEEALGFLDRRSGTLLSCDCLQLRGVGRYGTGITDAQAYLQTLRRLETKKVENIVAAHEFVPLGALALGRERVLEYLKMCRAIISELWEFCAEHKELSDGELQRLYNERNAQVPPSQTGTLHSVRNLPEAPTDF